MIDDWWRDRAVVIVAVWVTLRSREASLRSEGDCLQTSAKRFRPTIQMVSLGRPGGEEIRILAGATRSLSGSRREAVERGCGVYGRARGEERSATYWENA